MGRFTVGSNSSRKMRQVSAIILCLAACTLVFSLDKAAAQSKLAGSEVRIGAAWGLTGVWRDWTTRNEIAAQMAVEEINAKGGIKGVPIKLITQDTASKPMEASRLVRKLAEDDKTLAILGPFSSSECEVGFPVGNKIGIPMIAQASSKPGVSAANKPYGLRNTMDELKLAMVSMDAFMKKNNVKKAAVVHDIKDAVSLSLGTDVLPAVFKKLGGAIINEGNYITYQTKDFDFQPQVTKLKGMDFEGIIFGGLYFDAVTFLKEVRRQGLKQNIIGGSPLINDLLPKQGGKDVEGTIAATTFHYSIAPQSFVSEFVKRAKEKGFDPPEPIMYDHNVYDAIYFIKHAIEQMDVTNKPEDLQKDREKLGNGLRSIKTFKGIVGPVAFNEDGDGDKPVYVAEVKDGTWFIYK